MLFTKAFEVYKGKKKKRKRQLAEHTRHLTAKYLSQNLFSDLLEEVCFALQDITTLHCTLQNYREFQMYFYFEK